MPEIKPCRNCGKEFVANRGGAHHYCTRDCAREKERARRKEREKRYCKECRSLLNASRGQMQFCSTKCRDEAKARNQRKSKRGRTHEIDITPVLPPIEWPSDAKKSAVRASTLAQAETFSKTSTQTALNRENALTGHCGAVSHGARQASTGGGE